ncbi:MAG TPA: hypothetical protein VHY21_20285 [Pseudonocardiaceae bacterium]|nr:hypothetical protein [Pseudonocardiaceae bacterium]
MASDVAPRILAGVPQYGDRVVHETLMLEPRGQLGALLCALVY